MAIDRLESGAIIHVGQLVHITDDEMDALTEAAMEMERCIVVREPGWLRSYLKSHTIAGKVLNRAIKRSHAS